MKNILMGFVAALTLSACSMVVNGPTDDVAFNTPGVEDAECHVWTPKNRYRVLTPGVVRVERSQYDLEYTCIKEGYVNAKGTVPRSVEPITYANVLNGIGFLVDGYEGAAFMYPPEVNVKMQPGGGRK